MKRIICVALTLAAGMIQGAGISAQASGSIRPAHAAVGGHGAGAGFHPLVHRHAAIRHAGIRHAGVHPPFRFAGFGYAPAYRSAPVIVIDNRVILNVPRPRLIPTVAELPVVMGIRRQPAADPVIHQVGRSFTVATMQTDEHPGQRRSRSREQVTGYQGQHISSQPKSARLRNSGPVSSDIMVVRGF